MIRCIAVDDEPLALELLEDNISKVPFLQLVGSCSNAMEAMRILQEQTVDLVFLDIQMPGLTGLQLVESMVQKPMIIFITAYEKHAVEAFGLSVIDYLVKPVAFERFVKACNKALDLHQLRTKNKETVPQNPPEYFFVNVDYSLLKVVYADITYIEGLKDYIKIHLQNNPRPIVTRMAMKSIEEQLPSSNFVRIHKSYIVSISHITAVKKTSVFIGTLELPISDNYRDSMALITGRFSS